MKTSQLLTLAVATFGLTTGAVAQGNSRGRGGNNGGNAGAAATTTAAAAAASSTTAAAAGGNTGNNGGDNPLLLLSSNVQAASDFIGNADVEAGQSNSVTDPANFINFCTGKTLTNGTQNTAGSCNGVVMGDIPSNNNMVSAIVLFPGPGDDLTPNQSFNIQVQLTNLVAGSFTDPLTTYYSAPQQLEGGNIVGHCHVTVQDLGNTLAPTTPPDPKTFAFFKGIDDDGNGKGLLQATVTNGLPAGFYRICTLNSASNHQPVLMPVAQRGGQDDCQKFTVGQGSGNAGGSAAGGNGGNNNAAASSSTTAAAAATTSAAADGAGNGNGSGNGAAATTTSAAASTQTGTTGSNSTGGNIGSGRGGRFGGGRGRFGRGRGRFAARDTIA